MPRFVQREREGEREREMTNLTRFELTSVESRQTGTFEGRSTDLATAKTNGFKGADAYLFQSDHSGRFPLHWAAVYAFPEVAEILIKEGEKKINLLFKTKNSYCNFLCREKYK